MAFIAPMMAAAGGMSGALGIASTALGVLGSISSMNQASAAAKQQEANANYQAQMADIRAKQTYAAAGAQEDLQRQRARQALGTQLASNAQAGGGLNTDLVRQSLFGAENDALAIRYDGALQAQGLKDEAALQRANAANARYEGKQAKTAGFLNAATALTTGASRYYGQNNKL